MSETQSKHAGRRTMDAILAGLNCGASANDENKKALLRQQERPEGDHNVF